MNAQVENTTVAAAAIKLTRTQKLQAKVELLKKRILADNETLVEVEAELNGAAALAAVTVGSAIIVKVGRKFADRDTTRFVPGVVLGVKEDEESGAKSYKVQYGEGFDAEVTVVGAAALTLPVVEEVAAE